MIEKLVEVPIEDRDGYAFGSHTDGQHSRCDEQNSNRSVWADFLFEMQIRAQNQSTMQAAWDMSTFLKERKAKKQLGQACEACELLTYGARRRKPGHVEIGVGLYMLANDTLSKVFAEELYKLIRLLDKMQGRERQVEKKESLCVVM
jgi:hypothetical protein